MARNRFRSECQRLSHKPAQRSRFRPILEQLEGRIVPSTWNGGGLDNNWMTAANWVGDVAPHAGDNLVFPAGAAQTTNNNNFAAGTAFKSLTFSGDGYQISGNGITLMSGITADQGVNNFYLPISLAAGHLYDGGDFDVNGSANLFLNGAVNNNGHLLRADAGALSTLSFTGTISGAGGLWKTGSGMMVLSAANTYSGETTLSDGTLTVSNNSAVGTGTLRLQTATLQNTGPTVNLANPVILSGTTTLDAHLGFQFTGPATLTANRTLNFINDTFTAFYNTIGESGGSFKLSKAGSGTLLLAGNNTFSGGLALGAGGNLTVGSNAAAGTGSLTLYGGTIFDFAQHILGNPVTMAGNFTVYTSSELTFTGPVTLTGNRTVSVTNGTARFDGAIGQSGGAWQLRMAGSGTLVLAADSTYTGGTKVLSGTLALGNNSAMGTGPLFLKAGSQVAADGTPRAIANPLILNGNSSFAGVLDMTFTGTVTLSATRAIAVSNGMTTFSGVIGESLAGSMLIKVGLGTLLLAGDNTFTGGVRVVDGTLAVGTNNALGTGPVILQAASIRADGAARTLANAFTLASDPTVAGTNDLTLSGPMSLANGTRIITISNTGLTTFSGPVSGDGMIKQGAGTLVLTGNNTYLTTEIFAGVVRVDGFQPDNVVIVDLGATLTGSGTVGLVTVHDGAFLNPGPGTAILHTGSVDFAASPNFVVDLNGQTAGAGYDQIQVTGSISLGTTGNLNVTLGFTPVVGTSFTILDNDGTDAVSGTFAGLAEGATFSQNGLVFQISYVGGTGNDVVLTRI